MAGLNTDLNAIKQKFEEIRTIYTKEIGRAKKEDLENYARQIGLLKELIEKASDGDLTSSANEIREALESANEASVCYYAWLMHFVQKRDPDSLNMYSIMLHNLMPLIEFILKKLSGRGLKKFFTEAIMVINKPERGLLVNIQAYNDYCLKQIESIKNLQKEEEAKKEEEQKESIKNAEDEELDYVVYIIFNRGKMKGRIKELPTSKDEENGICRKVGQGRVRRNIPFVSEAEIKLQHFVSESASNQGTPAEAIGLGVMIPGATTLRGKKKYAWDYLLKERFPQYVIDFIDVQVLLGGLREKIKESEALLGEFRKKFIGAQDIGRKKEILENLANDHASLDNLKKFFIELRKLIESKATLKRFMEEEILKSGVSDMSSVSDMFNSVPAGKDAKSLIQNHFNEGGFMLGYDYPTGKFAPETGDGLIKQTQLIDQLKEGIYNKNLYPIYASMMQYKKLLEAFVERFTVKR